MNYFFILGNHPDLSAAELRAYFKPEKELLFRNVYMAQLPDFDAAQAVRALGGTIKIGRLIKTISKQEIEKTALEELLKAPKQGKFNFGISVYGKLRLPQGNLGLDLKTALKKEGISCRFVTSREETLSSVVVEQNKLVRGGRELIFIGTEDGIYFGITEAVQAFKELSSRDYGRPGRDDHSGMLPPKLAQIMINLAQAKKSEILLDPFCGSGTILTEGLLLGYTKLYGSDISGRAIDDTKLNMEWIAKRAELHYDLRLSILDALDLSKHIASNSIGAIVTETYLGPQRGRVDHQLVSAELRVLYSKVLEQCARIIKPGGHIVMALPIFSQTNTKINPSIPAGLTKKDSFVYGRAGQRVFREIIILEKK